MTDPATHAEQRGGGSPLRERADGDGRARRRRTAGQRQRVQRLRGRGALPLGLSDRAPLRLRVAPVERRSDHRLPSEARWVGDHADGLGREPVFAEHPGAWIRDHLRERRVARLGVYGLDYIMPVRDFRALEQGPFELVDFDVVFDLSRAVKSEEELALVRESMAINEAGFWAVHEAYEPGRTQAELMAAAERTFTRLAPVARQWTWSCGGAPGRRRPNSGSPTPRPRSRPTTCCCTRSRSPARRALGRVLAPADARRGRRRHRAHARGLRRVRRGRPRDDAPRATAHDVPVRSRRRSTIAATRSATSPGTRSG